MGERDRRGRRSGGSGWQQKQRRGGSGTVAGVKLPRRYCKALGEGGRPTTPLRKTLPQPGTREHGYILSSGGARRLKMISS